MQATYQYFTHAAIAQMHNSAVKQGITDAQSARRCQHRQTEFGFLLHDHNVNNTKNAFGVVGDGIDFIALEINTADVIDNGAIV